MHIVLCRASNDFVENTDLELELQFFSCRSSKSRLHTSMLVDGTERVLVQDKWPSAFQNNAASCGYNFFLGNPLKSGWWV